MSWAKKSFGFFQVTDEFSIFECRKNPTCLEDLQNELFYEIFEYLDGFCLHNTFSKLNKRFQDLMKMSNLRLHFDFPSSNIDKQYKQFLLENKRQIRSFSIANIWMSQSVYPILNLFDQSFERLKSIHLTTTSLNHHDLTSVYQIIFNVPSIKSSKISFEFNVTHVYRSNTRYPETRIQHLNMDHLIDLHDLKLICASTKQLYRLDCRSLIDPIDDGMFTFPTNNLSSLTHLSIENCEISFENFKNFIQIISPLSLKCLCLSLCSDINYLNAYQWEKLIVDYLPNLQIFHLTYEEYYDEQFELNRNHIFAHKFTSSFWTRRQWFLDITLRVIDSSVTQINYTIRSYKQTLTKNMPVSLTIDDPCCLDWNENTIGAIQLVSDYVPITYLNLDCVDIGAEHIIRFLRSLSHLDSIKIFSFRTPMQVLDNFDSIARSNHITKVHIERINRLEQVKFIFDLCLYLQYLEVECTSQIDILSVLHIVSIQIINRTLSTLCIKSEQINEKSIEAIPQSIENERLFETYEIQFRDKKMFIYFL